MTTETSHPTPSSNDDEPQTQSQPQGPNEEMISDALGTGTLSSTQSALISTFKVVASVLLLISSLSTYTSHYLQRQAAKEHALSSSSTTTLRLNDQSSRRRLSFLGGDDSAVPSYMMDLFEDLKARKKLFDDTPPEEVKYWFEYTGPLQVCSWMLTVAFYSISINTIE